MPDFTTFRGQNDVLHNPLALSYYEPQTNKSLCQLHIIRSINQQFRRCMSTTAPAAPKSDDPADVLANRTRVVVTDRSLLSPLAFVESAYAQGSIGAFARDFLLEETLQMARHTLKETGFSEGYSGIFFMQEEAETCMERVRKRARPYELASLDVECLNRLSAHYEVYLNWYKTPTGGEFYRGGEHGIRLGRRNSLKELYEFIENLVEAKKPQQQQQQQQQE